MVSFGISKPEVKRMNQIKSIENGNQTDLSLSPFLNENGQERARENTKSESKRLKKKSASEQAWIHTVYKDGVNEIEKKK